MARNSSPHRLTEEDARVEGQFQCTELVIENPNDPTKFIELTVGSDGVLRLSGVLPTIFDIPADAAGKPGAGANLERFTVASKFTLAAALAGSQGVAQTAATGSSVFNVQKQTAGTGAFATVGTATFAASGTHATFAAASAVTFNAGDVFQLVAPAVQDATLADVSITLKGQLA